MYDTGYVDQCTQQFLQLWGVHHLTSISHSPTGQAIIEHFHSTLEAFLQKQKGGMQGDTPQERVCKAVFTQNHLTIPPSCTIPVTLTHF